MSNCDFYISDNINGRNVIACSVCGRAIYGELGTIRNCRLKPPEPPAAAPAKKSGCGCCGKAKARQMTPEEKAERIKAKLNKL